MFGNSPRSTTKKDSNVANNNRGARAALHDVFLSERAEMNQPISSKRKTFQKYFATNSLRCEQQAKS